MQENYKILVVDDDMRLRALLERYLTEQGFQVRSVANAEQMDRLLTRESFHLMVLDLMLPGEDGLSICRRLRSQSNPMPIIMVTAKGEEVDRIVGLEIGADDYIPKPFSMKELRAHINALLRRTYGFDDEKTVTFGDITVDIGSRTVTKGGNDINLSMREFDLLAFLCTHPNTALTKDKLLSEVWGAFSEVEPKTLAVHIRWLREKLEDNPAEPQFIKTVYKVGYILEVEI